MTKQATDLETQLIKIAQAAVIAAKKLALAPNTQKNTALTAIAAHIRQHSADIQEANAKDITKAQADQQTAAFIDRLTLDAARIEAMAAGLVAIAELADPVGRELATWQQPNGLQITRVSVPLGVIGVIYESRPNVTADAAGLCLKSGNAVILRGGSDSFHSAQAIMHCITAGLHEANLPTECVQMIPTTDRAAVGALLQLDQYIDVIIPRGGLSLIKRVAAESRIPVFKHLAGVCHTYVHQAADQAMATDIVLNAKMRRPGICGATETLLIDKAIAASYLPTILKKLHQAGCAIRGDAQVVQLDPQATPASDEDWDSEYLDAVLAVKIVEDLDAAIAHVNQHGSQHTEAIITADAKAAQRFLDEVNSAIVMHNTSTQFADGGEFGMGAEIGIATGKLHARGPVGVEQLTTFKYQVHGSGQVRG